MLFVLSFYFVVWIFCSDEGEHVECGGIKSDSASVCNGHGVCGWKGCECLMCTYVGDNCEREFCLEGRNICTINSFVETQETEKKEESCPSHVLVERVEPNSCNSFYWIVPCAPSLVGNVVLLVVSIYFLIRASKLIGEGGEMLLIVFPPTIIGGFVMPILGSLQDVILVLICTIPIFYGDSSLSQDLLSIGIGSITGSTIFLTTLVFGTLIMFGKGDLNSEGIQKEEVSTQLFGLFNQGVSFDSEVVFNAIISLLSSLVLVVIHLEDIPRLVFFRFEEENYKSYKLLITSFLCLFSFFAYSIYQVLQAQNEVILIEEKERELEREEMGDRKTNEDEYNSDDELDKLLILRISGDYDDEEEGEEDEEEEEESGIDTEEEDYEADEYYITWSSRKILVVAVLKIIIGVTLQIVFSFPMVQTLHYTSNHFEVDVFYLALLITPICSNLTEIQATLAYAGKKKKLHNQVCFSQIFAAAIMNNTLLLSFFTFIFYWFKGGLRWVYFGEIVGIWFVSICMGLVMFISKFSKYTLRLYWVVLIFLLYPVSLAVIVYCKNRM